MKKIIIFGLFVILAVGCAAQNYEIFTNLKNIANRYENYLTNGSFRKAGELEDDLIRWNTWLILNLLESAETELDSMDYAKTKLDNVAGVTLNVPNYIYDATLGSVITVDSIRITGDSWTTYLHTNDSINTMIDEYEHGTLYFTSGSIQQVSSSIMHIFPGSGTDKIIIAVNVAPYGLTLGGFESLHFSGADDYMMAFMNDSTRAGGDSTYTWSAGAIRDYVQPVKDTNTSHNTRILVNLGFIEDLSDTATDHNTRILSNLTDIENLQDTADKHTDSIQAHNSRILEVVPVGSQYAIQINDADGTFGYDNDFTIQGDSARLKNVNISSGLRLSAYSYSDSMGIYLLPNGLVDTLDYSRTAGWMLDNIENIEPFDIFFNNRDKKRELNWPRYLGEDYHKINVKDAHVQFMAAHERTWIYMAELYKKNKDLEIEVYRQKEKINELEGRTIVNEAMIITLMKRIDELKK